MTKSLSKFLRFEINFKNYHDMCLKRDVLLLVDVFEKFSNNDLENYGFCQSHYFNVAA